MFSCHFNWENYFCDSFVCISNWLHPSKGIAFENEQIFKVNLNWEGKQKVEMVELLSMEVYTAFTEELGISLIFIHYYFFYFNKKDSEFHIKWFCDINSDIS